MTPGTRSKLIWIGALALALALLAADSARRARGLEAATDTPVGARLEPEPEPLSPSGYRWGQHKLVMTQADSYHWLLQAEQAMNTGAFRVRAVGYDNAPSGRQVHWAGFLRWWTLGLTHLYRLGHPGLTGPQALERVAPWANTTLLVVVLLTVTPLVAARFGSVPAGLLALGSVAVFPYYDFYSVGYLDHHGATATACLLALLCMVAGGAGWIRSGKAEEGRKRGASGPRQRAPWEWLPTQRGARRWFVASGLAGAVGLWISAATTVPVLAAIGLGALFGSGVAARVPSAHEEWRVEPRLFRAWGLAGAAGSFGLYLLEYFPGQLGMRLEVNHPLYALAFLGGGDLICRLSALLSDPRSRSAAAFGRSDRRSRSAVGWILVDLALILSLPAVLLVTGESTFRLSDPFLLLFHDRYILEFLSLDRWMPTRTPTQLVGQVSLVPLIVLPLAARLWRTALPAAWRLGWRALLLFSVGVGTSYAYVFSTSLTGGNEVAGAVGAAGAAGLWFLLPLSTRTTPLSPPRQSALAIAALPVLLLLLLSFFQNRWLGIAGALGLGALVVTAHGMLEADPSARRGRGEGVAMAVLAFWVLVLAPVVAVREPFVPLTDQVVARDASLWLRRRLGDDPGVVLAGPTSTTQMIWFGGFRGIGTLYWENLEGLRAATEIYRAPDQAAARSLLARHGVTHLALYRWDAGLDQLQRSASAAEDGGQGEGDRGFLGRLAEDVRADRHASLPPWLVPLPYVPARVAGFHHPVVQLFEVVDELPPEIAAVELARYYYAIKDERMEQALARSLELGPSVPGLAIMAQLLESRGDRPAFLEAITRLRRELARAEPIDVADRLDAVIALGLAGDRPEAARQLAAALAQADERQLRRLSQKRLALLVDVSVRLGVDRLHPEAIALARSLLPR